MVECTISPRLFLPPVGIAPEDFNDDYLVPVSMMIELCDQHDVDLVSSSELLDQIILSFPWEREDEGWRDVIYDGICGVLHRLTENLIDVNIDQVNEIPEGFVCFRHEVARPWFEFLEIWKNQAEIYNGHIVKGIFAHRFCVLHFSCSEFYILSSINLDHLLHPWLTMYPSDLPVNGEYPFRPVDNWKLEPIPRRGVNHGYLDNRGNEWEWDDDHDDHWDVQLRGGGYLNVYPDGRIKY